MNLLYFWIVIDAIQDISAYMKVKWIFGGLV